MRMKNLLLAVCGLGMSFQASMGQTLKVWPGTTVGSGVTYGADVKLTLFKITNNNAVNLKFVDLGMDMVRVPIVAHWLPTNTNYTTIKTYVTDAKAKGLNIFASIANSNGQFKANGDLDDAHGEHKFPSSLKCGTCVAADSGLYNVKRSAYKTYLQDVVVNKITNVSWVGPWNEDDAAPADYSSLDWGKSIVGSELWNLSTSDAEMNQVGSVIDLGGAHNYESTNLMLAYTNWKNFVAAGGDWFTESTLFGGTGQNTAAGIAHMLPAMSAGIKKIIIYQTVPRIVNPNGTNGTSYTAVKELISYSKGKGAALQVETNNQNYVASAFKSGTQLILHVCNISSATQMVYINLQGYSVSTTGANVAKFGGTTADVTFANLGKQVKVNLSANTYARIVLDGLAIASARTAALSTVEQSENLVVYPNPNSQQSVHIRLPEAETTGKVKVMVMDILGKVVMQHSFEGLRSFELPVGNHLARGLYKLVVQTEGRTYTHSLVMER